MYPTPVNDTFIEAGKALMTRALDLVLGAENPDYIQERVQDLNVMANKLSLGQFICLSNPLKGKLPWLMCDLTNYFLPEASCVC